MGGSTAPFVVAGGGDNFSPAIAALPNGNFAVAYVDTGVSGETQGISLTIRGPDGTLVNEVHVNAPKTPARAGADLTVLANGFIVVTWTRPSDSAPIFDDVVCRIFDENGNPIIVGSQPLDFLLTGSPDAENFSSLAEIGAGKFLVAWQDSETDGSDGRIGATIKELVRTTTGDGGRDAHGDQIRDDQRQWWRQHARRLRRQRPARRRIGADAMSGGAGDDSFIVDDAGDTPSESSGAGTDTVQSTALLHARRRIWRTSCWRERRRSTAPAMAPPIR